MKKAPPQPSPLTDAADTLAAIAPVARSSVVDAVSDRLRNEILAGRIAAGSRLPSERELSLALGVNRLTLRAALARLEAMGLVVTRHGSGTEVAAWQENAGLEALGMVMASLEPGEPAWVELLASLLEVRRILVSEAVALAAERHTAEDLATMQRLADEQNARVDDAVAFARGDIAFQRAVLRAAKNVGFELMLNSFARFPDEHPQLIEKLYDVREYYRSFYGAVIELIRSRDGANARENLRSAFNSMDEEWLARHGHKRAGVKAASKVAAPAAKRKKGKK
jgi:GntR family transcriptional regulator, transcriptional repressor for pyruvate dehydrogenase complex